MASHSQTQGRLSSRERADASTSFSKMLHSSWLKFVCFMICLQFAATVDGGTEAIRSSETVRISVDSRWPGNAHGGYVPLRIKLTNLGPEQDFQLIFNNVNARDYDRMPEVRRTVHLEQNATRDLTLPVPMVSFGNGGDLRVLDGRGKEIEELKTAHSFPDYGGDNARASLLVIAADDVEEKWLEPFEDAAATECALIRGLAGAAAGSRYPTRSMIEVDHLIVPPISLPENWTDYSGVDLIAISWTNLNSKLKTSERDALLKWAACGGVLIIYGTEKPAAEMQPLHQLLHLDSASGKRWSNIDLPILETPITTAKSLNLGASSGRMTYSPPRRVINGGAAGLGSLVPVAAPRGIAVNHWIQASNIPVYRDWSFGRIYVFPHNPFPGVANDWAWLLASMPQNQSRWSSRLGMASRNSSTEFLNFLIPGVGSVPVHAFLVLITIFTIVIGPLNYYWLRKTRRVGALVFTVPLIASVACLMLFVYSIMADGFSIRSRVQSVTFLDQQAKSAASISRLCLYAPFAPSGGLKYSSSVAAFPIWPVQQRFEGGVVDWTGNEQHLFSGWFRSQTWTQFLLIEQRDERGRLDFTPPTDPNADTLTISNGFSWDLEYLALELNPGQWYVGEKIPASGTAQLKRSDSENVGRQFAMLHEPHSWAPPDGMNLHSQQYGMGGPGGFPPGRYPAFGRINSFAGPSTLSDGQLRRYQNGATMPGQSPNVYRADWRTGQNQVQSLQHSEVARPHFWAVCSQNPGVEIGVKNSVDKGSFHLLFGLF